MEVARSGVVLFSGDERWGEEALSQQGSQLL